MARGDAELRSAEALLEVDRPELEPAAFHCHQAAERYLKGLLVYHGDEPPRTRNLRVLVDLAARFDRTLRELHDSAAFLNPFGSRLRDPLAAPSPTWIEARIALRHARAIREAARERIGAPGTPAE